MDDRLALFIEFFRQKIEIFSDTDEYDKQYLMGMLQGLIDAEVFHEATPEWLANVGVTDGVR